ncbi:hypothetical protein [Klebsiella pneumoniae]|uniref:hypothetical protein n=1 Tax=Klebsiella pneumoniae TaxID=573 RepID=UPI0014330EB1|nr:hypothetical protein [Klebsiella pneumoniae]QIU99973.1 hypothetical protein HC645_12745 [Klebsiella pneumoniae]
MKKTVFLSSMLLFPFFVDAAGSGVDFELKSTPVPDALSVFYTQILKKPYRLSPIRRQLPRPHRDNYSGLFVI